MVHMTVKKKKSEQNYLSIAHFLCSVTSNVADRCKIFNSSTLFLYVFKIYDLVTHILAAVFILFIFEKVIKIKKLWIKLTPLPAIKNLYAVNKIKVFTLSSILTLSCLRIMVQHFWLRYLGRVFCLLGPWWRSSQNMFYSPHLIDQNFVIHSNKSLRCIIKQDLK